MLMLKISKGYLFFIIINRVTVGTVCLGLNVSLLFFQTYLWLFLRTFRLKGFFCPCAEPQTVVKHEGVNFGSET